MGFTEAVKACLSKYATFSGRALRSEYWYFYLFNVLASIVLGVVDSMAFGMQAGILRGLFGLAMILPTLAAGARRLHDTDRSGWWQLLWFVPIIGWIILIVFLATPGTGADNRFDAAPSSSHDDDDEGFATSSVPTVDRD